MPASADNENSANLTRAGASRGLDWFNLFVANIQTGFGPFIAVYLSSQSWTQTSIGLALSIGTISSMASQVPAGALVDLMPNKARVAAFSVLVFMVSALMFAIHPIPLFVYLGEILHGISSCTLGPAIAAMSLVIAGRFAMGLRLGRNARYAAIGNGVGAALMGACGQYVSERAVFYLTAALTLPALFALLPLRRSAIAGGELLPAPRKAGESRAAYLHVLSDRRLLIFSACAMLFTFANAPLLMLISGTLTAKGSNPSLLIAACIVLPQIIVALASPSVGRLAERRGRRMVLTIGLSMLPLRCLLFATSQNPTLLVTVQVLDGVAAACFGIMVPLIVSDVAGGSGHFNLSLGAVGFGIGIGGTLSTPAAGWMADHFGSRLAFFALTGIGLAAVLVALVMPETRPSKEAEQDVSGSAAPGRDASSDVPSRDVPSRDVPGTDAPRGDAPGDDAPSNLHGDEGGDAQRSEPGQSEAADDATPKPKPPTRRRA
ncbi:MAG TPA: MFS transporter [Steroidobacteraceae bacterium]